VEGGNKSRGRNVYDPLTTSQKERTISVKNNVNESFCAEGMSKNQKKYKVGYTTGVFDLFHIGHLNIIKKAKECCEHLIVGVSTDELVMQYKKKKPVIPFEERVAIVAAIKYVDEVVVQEIQDKVLAWHKYKYDCVCVGNDWQGSEMMIKVERELGPKGVDVVIFPRTENTSSTMLTEALIKISS